ncbi:MAG: 16S rRNA (cytidine(1402)-2'-O)-methyltransferase [Candidatus Komeilibacteria bacterium]
MPNVSTLFIVATPLGNLNDISLRALDTLRNVDVIACEDTRVSSKLLAHYDISKPLLSYWQHSKSVQTEKVLALLGQGKTVALLTDAGTPGIADPGGRLVAAVSLAGYNVIPVPGPSAIVTALSISGFAADEFMFFGFLPHKKGRQTKLQEVVTTTTTAVLYESVHRIEKLLQQLIEYGIGDRRIVLARELTKKFETIYRGTAKEVLAQLSADTIKGEFVLVMDRKN